MKLLGYLYEDENDMFGRNGRVRHAMERDYLDILEDRERSLYAEINYIQTLKSNLNHYDY